MFWKGLETAPQALKQYGTFNSTHLFIYVCLKTILYFLGSDHQKHPLKYPLKETFPPNILQAAALCHSSLLVNYHLKIFSPSQEEPLALCVTLRIIPCFQNILNHRADIRYSKY